MVASELQCELRKLEQMVRWQTAKADALSGWEGWPHLGEEPIVSRLMVVRHAGHPRRGRPVRDTDPRRVPAHPDDALAALTGLAPWPGPALVWAMLDSRGARWASGR